MITRGDDTRTRRRSSYKIKWSIIVCYSEYWSWMDMGDAVAEFCSIYSILDEFGINLDPRNPMNVQWIVWILADLFCKQIRRQTNDTSLQIELDN